MMLGHWVLETAGWLLLGIGLYAFYTCFGFLNEGQVVEGGVGGAIGFAIFRGGVNLIRLSVASRVVHRDANV